MVHCSQWNASQLRCFRNSHQRAEQRGNSGTRHSPASRPCSPANTQPMRMWISTTSPPLHRCRSEERGLSPGEGSVRQQQRTRTPSPTAEPPRVCGHPPTRPHRAARQQRLRKQHGKVRGWQDKGTNGTATSEFTKTLFRLQHLFIPTTIIYYLLQK